MKTANRVTSGKAGATAPPSARLNTRHRPSGSRRAFTLIEVMFAIVAFCVAMFAILALVSNSLRGARLLQRPMVDAGEVASFLSQTNLVEGTYTKNLGDLLGDTYDRYDCKYVIQEVQTNKLFEVSFVIRDNQDSSGNPVSKMSILLYSPNSPAGSLDGPTGTP